MKCELHDDLVNRISELTRQIHDVKVSIIRVLIATVSASTALISAGVIF